MTQANAGGNKWTKPPWLVPVIILAVIVGLVTIGRKHERAIENPLVDLTIITFGVFAIAAAMRVLGYKLDNPGFAAFFGGHEQQTTEIR